MGDNHHLVEGDWNNFVFKMIQPKDVDRVLKNFRQVFCKDEPICAGGRLADYPDRLRDLSTYAAYVLGRNDGLSFYAEDKATGKIAGIRVTYITHQDDPKEPPFPVESERVMAVFYNLVELGEKANIYGHYDITEYAELLFTSVNPEFRGQGLVTEIYRRSLTLLRARGVAVCKSTFSSPATQKVARRFGFEELARKDLADFKDGEDTPILPYAQPGEVAILMALKL